MITATVDREGIRGPTGNAPWTGFRKDGRVRWPFERPYENFRLLDPLTRFIAIAVEALDCAFEPNTAILLASSTGCLATDRLFEASRHAVLRPALFPYTLPSSPMAAVAIRHRVTGAGLCLSIAPDDSATALEEARRILAAGEASAVLVCVGDVLPGERMSMTATLVQP
jgi:hypothetical protein